MYDCKKSYMQQASCCMSEVIVYSINKKYSISPTIINPLNVPVIGMDPADSVKHKGVKHQW